LLLHYNGRLFKTTIDQNSDGYLSEAELSALVIGITDDASRDGQVDVKEFVEGISRWLKKLRRSATSGDSQDDQSIRILDHFHQVYILLHIISSSHACLCLCDESL